jgi:hypothetical protein
MLTASIPSLKDSLFSKEIIPVFLQQLMIVVGVTLSHALAT